MQKHKALVFLALLPVVASAQTSVYSTNFSTGALRTSGTTYNVGDWTVAATKNSTNSLSGSGLGIGITAAPTTSGFVETQNRFTATPVTLSSVTDYVELKVAFTDNNNVLAGGSGTNSYLAIGLFDSSGANPAIGLQSSGLTTATGSAFATGNAAGWEGYAARIAPTGGSSSIVTRPIQNGAGTTSANQELIFNAVGGGAYTNPAGTSLGSASSTLPLLTNGQQYTASLRITMSNTNEYTVLYSLLNASNTVLQSISKTSTAGTFISGLSVDGLAFGYRYNGASSASNLTVTSVDVSTFAIPEPSTCAALAGAVGLGMVAIRRRRRA